MACVGGLLVRDGLALLGLRSTARAHYPGVWDVLGGHVLPGERPRDALIRELREEIGVTPTHMALISVAQHKGLVESYEYHVYVVTGWEGTPENLQPEEHTEIRWFALEQCEELRLADPAYLDLLRHALHVARSG